MDQYKFVGHIVSFWLWALDHASDDGHLPGLPFDVLGSQSGLNKKQGRVFIESLIESGFLEGNDGRLVIHDWERYAGRLNAKRASNALRQEKYRGMSRVT